MTTTLQNTNKTPPLVAFISKWSATDTTTGGTAKSFKQEKPNHKFAMPYFDVNCSKKPYESEKTFACN